MWDIQPPLNCSASSTAGVHVGYPASFTAGVHVGYPASFTAGVHVGYPASFTAGVHVGYPASFAAGVRVGYPAFFKLIAGIHVGYPASFKLLGSMWDIQPPLFCWIALLERPAPFSLLYLQVIQPLLLWVSMVLRILKTMWTLSEKKPRQLETRALGWCLWQLPVQQGMTSRQQPWSGQP